jgi:hypothetical protein
VTAGAVAIALAAALTLSAADSALAGEIRPQEEERAQEQTLERGFAPFAVPVSSVEEVDAAERDRQWSGTES